ncbi:MAG: hypothetical protein LBH58_05395 [Tannerellaceae bacterium]|jgi:DNA-directed RNA polymerase subunit M/transcription elongation factor TFIIS|nr:hypothetical protein [Tannerellaceae bacterium]
MNDFIIRKHQNIFIKVVNKVRGYLSSLRRKKQHFIIKREINHQAENENMQSISDTPVFKIINIKHNVSAIQDDIVHPKIIIQMDRQNDRPRRSNPKRCPLCGSIESAYQRVVLREDDRWKCAICGNTW